MYDLQYVGFQDLTDLFICTPKFRSNQSLNSRSSPLFSISKSNQIHSTHNTVLGIVLHTTNPSQRMHSVTLLRVLTYQTHLNRNLSQTVHRVAFME